MLTKRNWILLALIVVLLGGVLVLFGCRPVFIPSQNSEPKEATPTFRQETPSSTSEEQAIQGGNVQEVTLDQLLSMPERYDNQKVKVRGGVENLQMCEGYPELSFYLAKGTKKVYVKGTLHTEVRVTSILIEKTTEIPVEDSPNLLEFDSCNRVRTLLNNHTVYVLGTFHMHVAPETQGRLLITAEEIGITMGIYSTKP